MQSLISTSNSDSVIYISNIMDVTGQTPVETYARLLSFDVCTYLNKVASQIGYVSQLDFRMAKHGMSVEVHPAPFVGSISHLPMDILDIRKYAIILAENSVNEVTLRQDLEALYTTNGYAVGLEITLKAYQMTQYAVINQGVARMGGLFFGYASICLDTAKHLYQLSEVTQSIELIKNLRSDAEVMQEVFAEPQQINKYLPVPIPLAKLAAIGVCTGIGLFVTMNMGKFAPLLM